MRNRRSRVIIGFLVLGISVCPFGPSAYGQQSASFQISRLTVSPTANVSSSASFEARLSFGEEGPVGGASFCNAGFASSMGFWSIDGEVSVPIVLSLSRQPADSSVVELSWTGAVSEFELYRSDMANDVLQPVHLTLTTAECSATDTPPSTSDVHFYSVVATGGAP